jgi:hypothetical protein
MLPICRWNGLLAHLNNIFLFGEILASVPPKKLPCHQTPALKNKILDINFAKILAIEIKVRYTLDTKGEWLATGGSFFHSQFT